MSSVPGSGGQPSTGRPLATSFSNSLGGFQAMTYNIHQEESKQIALDTPEFALVATLVDYAIRIVETETGQSALEQVGKDICEVHTKEGVYPAETPNLIIQDMAHIVNDYVCRLRQDFFTVFVMEVQPHVPAMAVATSSVIVDGFRYTVPGSFGSRVWRPKSMGFILIHEVPLSSIAPHCTTPASDGGS